MKNFVLSVSLALAGLVLGVVIRLSGVALSPPVAALIYGLTIVSAGFLLSWGAESERHFSRGLVLAVIALVTVLPEYSVDLYLAYKAGANPSSNYVEYAAANMTGANRMLVGLIWPLLVLLYRLRSGRRAVSLTRENVAEIAFLGVASAYAFVIAAKASIGVIDLLILAGIFAAYMWRVSRFPAAAEEPGPAPYLTTLPRWQEHSIIAGLILAAAVGIVAVTEPFAEALIQTGKVWGVNEFLLIQWLGPLASELPVIVVTVLFAMRQQPVAALASLISDKINQWTLLVGFLPVAFSLGAGRIQALPLLARQREEFLLTAAQSLFGLALLLNLELTFKGAVSLLVLFLAQLGLAFAWQADAQRSIQLLTFVAWGYLLLAGVLIALRRRRVPDLIRSGLFAQATPPMEKASLQ